MFMVLPESEDAGKHRYRVDEADGPSLGERAAGFVESGFNSIAEGLP